MIHTAIVIRLWQISDAHSRWISSPTIRRELRRRNAIEPIIGYTKSDGLIERNHLAGATGDAILVVAGYNNLPASVLEWTVSTAHRRAYPGTVS